MTTPAPYIASIPAHKIFADHTYQRDLDGRVVDRMAGDFDVTLLGVLEVSQRGPDQFAVIDGQHRWAAASTVREDMPLVCQVHRGLTVEDEARVFYETDHRRRNLSWWDRWRARRATGEQRVLDIDAVLARHNLQVNPSPVAGNIRATTTLEKIVAESGTELLASTLTVLNLAYGAAFDAYKAELLHGCALVLVNYRLGDEVDVDRLVGQLEGIAPRQLVARAAALIDAVKGTAPRRVAMVIVQLYNQSKGPKLESFSDRVAPSSKGGQTGRDARERRAIVEWGQANGLRVDPFRRVPDDVVAAYRRAHPAPAAARRAPETDDVVDQAEPPRPVRSYPPLPVSHDDSLLCADTECRHPARMHADFGVDGDDDRPACNRAGCYCAGYAAPQLASTTP